MKNHTDGKIQLVALYAISPTLTLTFLILIVLNTFFISPQKILASTPNVIINELMPNPVGTDTGNEWIELYNPTASQINLTGWTIEDKTGSFSLDEFSIEPQTYLVVFPLISLNNTDEEIILTNNQSYSDTINYSSSIEGISLERIGHECTDLEPHPTSHTKGLVNQAYDQNYCSSSSVEIYTKEENSSEWGQNNSYFLNSKIIFRAELTSLSSVTKTEWKFGEQVSHSAQPVFDANNIGNQILELKVTLDSQELIVRTAEIMIEPKIFLNEILPDPAGSDSGNEWLELYNPNNFGVDLNNWEIKIGDKSQTIENLTAESKNLAVVTSKNSIPNTNAKILLFTPSGLISDSFQYIETEMNKSWARTLDGEGEWGISDTTKGTTNREVTVGQKEKEENHRSSKQVKSASTLKLELKPPAFYDLQDKEVPQQESSLVKKTEVNKIGFTGFMASEIGIYLGMILNKEELTKVLSFIMKFIKG